MIRTCMRCTQLIVLLTMLFFFQGIYIRSGGSPVYSILYTYQLSNCSYNCQSALFNAKCKVHFKAIKYQPCLAKLIINISSSFVEFAIILTTKKLMVGLINKVVEFVFISIKRHSTSPGNKPALVCFLFNYSMLWIPFFPIHFQLSIDQSTCKNRSFLPKNYTKIYKAYFIYFLATNRILKNYTKDLVDGWIDHVMTKICLQY